MGRLLGWLPILLVACGDPPGLTLEVHVGDRAISSVELFIGGYCPEGRCPEGVAPPGLTPKPISNAYLVDDPTPWPKTVDNGIAGFRIEVDTDTTVGLILIVGYNGQGAIVSTSTFYDVFIPAGDSELWRIDDLVHTDPINDDPADRPPDGTDRIFSWRKPGVTTPACLLLEHWWSGLEPDRDVVVPATDTDCDGQRPNECAPWIYNAALAPPTLDTASCLKPTPDASGVALCLVGGPQCSETGLSTQACTELAEDYCTPVDLCTACATSTTPYQCLVAKIMTDTNETMTLLPHLQCRIALDENGDTCSTSPIIADGGVYLSSGATKCTAIRINDLKAPLGPFVTALEIDNGKLKLENFEEPCKVEVAFYGNATARTEIGLAELELDNGRHLVLPARLDLVRGGCDAPSACVFTPVQSTTETMLRCVTSPALSCARSATCPGAECDGTCCGPGESCVNGTCFCGEGAGCTNGNYCVQSSFSSDQCGSICCGALTPCPQAL